MRSHGRATRKNQFVFQSAEWFDLPVRFGWYVHLGFLGREDCVGGGGDSDGRWCLKLFCDFLEDDDESESEGDGLQQTSTDCIIILMY